MTQNWCIFLVDDDPATVDLIRTAVESAGMAFAAGERVEGSLEAIKNARPDLVLLDVMLPDGEGYEICRRMKQDQELASVPVIFLTSKKDVNSRVKGFEAGGIDYVPKPFAIAELLARIQAHLAVKSGQDALRQKVDELSTQQRVRQDIADMIMHDLRTPLGSIKVTLDLVRKSDIVRNPDFIQILQNAEAATDIALFLVNDVMDLGAGKLEAKQERVDLKLLVQRLHVLLTSRLKRLNLQLRSHIDEALHWITTDPSLLFRVLLNLITNAMKYSPPGKEIHLWIRSEAGQLRIEVVDEGPGVPDAEKTKIFQMFYRAPGTATLSKPGYGIGLAFCSLACRTLGGRIWVEDFKPVGSRFIALLQAGGLPQPTKPA